jgi:hypothetical protein
MYGDSVPYMRGFYSPTSCSINACTCTFGAAVGYAMAMDIGGKRDVLE